jgi:hypothetical protein
MDKYIPRQIYCFHCSTEYKEELVKSQKQNERLTALVGKVTVEKEWLAKKLKSLGL